MFRSLLVIFYCWISLNLPGTNAGFAEPLRRCREAVEDVDPIVKMVYRDNASKFAEWLAASRIEKR
jgi:hypothetical protein